MNVIKNKSIKAMWNLKASAITAMEVITPIFKSTHGMFAGVPIMCKGDKGAIADQCPYVSVCLVDPALRVVGARCPMEAATIIGRFEAWCAHFEINIEGDEIDPKDLVDATLIRDLVDNEVSMLRAENTIAISGDFVGQTLAQVSNKGKAYYESTITPESEYKLTLQNQRYKILNLLNSTRKDKAAEHKVNNNPSTHTASLFKKIGEKLDVRLDDVDFDAVLVESDLKTDLTSPKEDTLILEEKNTINENSQF